MARPKKNAEPIVGPGKDPEIKLTVQKSNPLLSLWRSDMSLAEFKILDTYLSRINSREPEKRTVQFTKGELEQLLGVKKINKADLVSRLKSLYRGVDIDVGNKKFHTVGLFEEAYGEMDDDGLWTVKLTCTAKAMKYIFNIEKLGYLQYKLRCITSLASRYTYILFLYLEKNRTMHLSWEVGVDELRQILNCDQDELYREFKFFNQRILKRCQKELHDKTECRFTYETIKRGKSVVSIRFTLESIAVAPAPVDEGQLSLFTASEDPIDAVAAVLPARFTREQVQAIYTAATPVAAGLYGVAVPTPAQVMGYLQNKMGLLMAYDAKEPIPRKDKYLLRMIENDMVKLAKTPIPGETGWEPSLGAAELEAIQQTLRTAGNDPEIAERAEQLKAELQNK